MQVEALLPDEQELVVHDWDALQPGLQQAIKADMSSAFFMYGILVILVAFSVLNTQLMSVLERTHVFGIVMALGLTPGRLGRLVLLETCIMGLLGFVLGGLLGVGLGRVGLDDFLESSFGSGVAGVVVRVEVLGHVAVGILDVILGRAGVDPEVLVVLLVDPLPAHRHPQPSRSSSSRLSPTPTMAGRMTRPLSR